MADKNDIERLRDDLYIDLEIITDAVKEALKNLDHLGGAIEDYIEQLQEEERDGN